jgi:lipopolysaccharide biosynthesis glycosyltransferase
MEEEPFSIHQYFCQNWDASVANSELNKLRLNYNIDQTGFNSGVMYFNTNIINQNTLNELLSLKESLQYINNHTNPSGGDQPILNLQFLQNIIPAANKEISYWRKANDDTVIMHFCRWDAPWVNNSHSNKLNNSYINQYNQNLNLFNKSFN